MDLIEAEDIKIGVARIHTTKQKDLHEPDNHDSVITHLEPDILECEVKWVLRSITMKKTGGTDGILVELFQILKDEAVKMLHSICQQIWKTQHGYKTGKDQFSFQIPKKGNSKERQHQRKFKLPHNCTHLTH